MSKLFNIGDSFAVGNCIESFNTHCENHLSPGALIADHFGLEEMNYARNGNSFDGILKDLFTLDFSDCSLISICTPPASRVYFRCTQSRQIDKGLRVPRLNKLVQKFPGLKLSSETVDAIKLAFTLVDRPNNMNPNHYYYTCSWPHISQLYQAYTHMTSGLLDVDLQVLYWQLLYILAIQSRLKCLNIPYIMWNGMSSLPSQIGDPELELFRSQVDETYFFRPDFKVWDLTIIDGDPERVNEEFAIHHDDSHPNHRCYYHWFDMVKDWILSSGHYNQIHRP